MSIQQNVNATLGIAGALYTQSPTAELRKENRIAEFNKQKELNEIEKEKQEVFNAYSDLQSGKLNTEMYGKLTGAGMDHDSAMSAINKATSKYVSKYEKKYDELNERILELNKDYAGKYRKDISEIALNSAVEQRDMAKQQQQEAAKRFEAYEKMERGYVE